MTILVPYFILTEQTKSNRRIGERSDGSSPEVVQSSAVKWTTLQPYSAADNNITIYYNTREVLWSRSKSNFPFSREPPRNTKATRNYSTIQYYNVLHTMSIQQRQQQWTRCASQSSTTTAAAFLISCPSFNIYYTILGVCLRSSSLRYNVFHFLPTRRNNLITPLTSRQSYIIVYRRNPSRAIFFYFRYRSGPDLTTLIYSPRDVSPA